MCLKNGRKERKMKISCPLCGKTQSILKIQTELELDGEETSLTDKWGTPFFNITEHARTCPNLKGVIKERKETLRKICNEMVDL